MRIAATLVLSLLCSELCPGPRHRCLLVTSSRSIPPHSATRMLASVAADPVGNFVVVWTSQQSQGDDDSGRSIQGQRYDASGAPVGGEFQINTYTTYDPACTRRCDGWSGQLRRCLVGGWHGHEQLRHSGQRFDSDGNPVGCQFQVNTYTTDEQTEPAVAMDSARQLRGGLGELWLGRHGRRLQQHSGQLYDSDGDPVGGEFQVNTITTSRQEDAAVAADGQGNFIVVWESNSANIKGQLYDDSGAAVGGEFRIRYRWIRGPP